MSEQTNDPVARRDSKLALIIASIALLFSLKDSIDREGAIVVMGLLLISVVVWFMRKPDK